MVMMTTGNTGNLRRKEVMAKKAKKPMKHGMKEEKAEMKGGKYRGGFKEEMAEMKSMKKSKGKKPAAKKKGK